MAQLGQKSSDETFVAVDFGTSASRIAYSRGEGHALVAELNGETEIPSVLTLSPEGGMLAGVDARNHQAIFPSETLIGLKSLFSADPEELRGRGHLFPQKIDSSSDQFLRLEIGGRPRTPLELIALYLLHLRQTAEVGMNRVVESAVFTVPVSFTPLERQAFRLAARMAGFQRVRLLDEPVAVALAAISRGVRGRLAVASWGAGYFGATVVEAQQDMVQVLASVGSSRLGGARIDDALAQDFLERVRAAGGEGFAHEATVARHLLEAARHAKQEIAARGKAVLQLRSGKEKKPVRHTYQAGDLNQWLDPLATKAAGLCRGLLQELSLGSGDVDMLLLAGGMVQIEAAAASLREVFGRDPEPGYGSLETAVTGALVRARFLERELAEPLVLDAMPMALGIEGQTGHINTLQARTERIPASKVELFTTYLEKQTEVAIQLYGHRGQQWERLAAAEIAKIPPMKGNQPKIEVTLTFDEDGVLNASAREMSKSKPLAVELRPPHGMTGNELRSIEEELPPHAEEDFSERLREELRVRGQLLLGTLGVVASRHASVMTRDEKHIIVSKTRDFEEVLEGGDIDEMRSCSRELAEAAQPVMQRVLDKSLETLLR
ncbi:MAG: Hsp70 family protein [Candidatus Eisenbacteria sp.]|nr:Hsp70 family protein [Candidatus Eisenbacteria bacterium]